MDARDASTGAAADFDPGRDTHRLWQTRLVERSRALDVIEQEAARILEIATDSTVARSAMVPTCPDWTLADLLNHLGRVYAMVTTVLSDPAGEPPDRQRIPTRPESQDPADWLRERRDLLLPMLAEIDADERRWNFVNGPAAPVGFWWRRQMHETSIHRVDAELAAGGPIGPAATDVAVDGIAERFVLVGLRQAGPDEPLAGSGLTIHLHATDGQGGEWSIDTEQDAFAHAHLKADVALRGPAWSLNRWLWRRGSALEDSGPARALFLADLEAFGDLPAAEDWRPARP